MAYRFSSISSFDRLAALMEVQDGTCVVAQGPKDVPWMQDTSLLMMAGAPVAQPSRNPGANAFAKLQPKSTQMPRQTCMQIAI